MRNRLWREKDTLLDWMFQLTKANMKDFYGKDWDDLQKMKELRSSFWKDLFTFFHDVFFSLTLYNLDLSNLSTGQFVHTY